MTQRKRYSAELKYLRGNAVIVSGFVDLEWTVRPVIVAERRAGVLNSEFDSVKETVCTDALDESAMPE